MKHYLVYTLFVVQFSCFASSQQTAIDHIANGVQNVGADLNKNTNQQTAIDHIANGVQNVGADLNKNTNQVHANQREIAMGRDSALVRRTVSRVCARLVILVSDANSSSDDHRRVASLFRH
ncbi:hypothetical protein Tcan_18076 [Toxocara canis]|uniref:Uncharacterized protein n=1 Tax=Toxocara canis TaxID=6265 RepID=A0A0B2V7D9_TOXCA|nr:hypothetical protein Tcan_18076 [Toxocara canis]